MPVYLQGLTMGLAYVAPIGAQNLFVINTALTRSRPRALLTALIVIFFDVTLALACFFGAGAAMERFSWRGSLLTAAILILLGGLLILLLVRNRPQEKGLLPLGDGEEVVGKRRRSVENIYNHRSVAEIVGSGFELVTGMLDVFMPCLNEIAREKAGGKRARYRSRRVAAMLPAMAFPHELKGTPAYCRLLRLLDYISGMSDRYAVSLYQRLKGISL